MTVTAHDEDMFHSSGRTAVCVVRVERQRNGLLITLVLNPDIDERSAQWSQRTSDIDKAMATVRQFFVAFAQEALW